MAGGFGAIIALGVGLYCILDISLTPPERIRTMPRLAWLLLVIFLPLLGGAAWLLLGRPAASGLAPGGGGGNGGPPPPPRRPPGPKGPDDDPDFLRRIDDQLRRGEDG